MTFSAHASQLLAALPEILLGSVGNAVETGGAFGRKAMSAPAVAPGQRLAARCFQHLTAKTKFGTIYPLIRHCNMRSATA